MSKAKQNLIVFKEPPANEDPFVHEIPFEVGNMCLNRFCIDEDAAFELSGIYDFQNIWVSNLEGKEQSYSKFSFVQHISIRYFQFPVVSTCKNNSMKESLILLS